MRCAGHTASALRHRGRLRGEPLAPRRDRPRHRRALLGRAERLRRRARPRASQRVRPHRPPQGWVPLLTPDRRRRPATTAPHRGPRPHEAPVPPGLQVRHHHLQALPPWPARGRRLLPLADNQRCPAPVPLPKGLRPRGSLVLHHPHHRRNRSPRMANHRELPPARGRLPPRLILMGHHRPHQPARRRMLLLLRDRRCRPATRGPRPKGGVVREERLGHRHPHRPAKGRRPLHLPDHRRRPATAVPSRGSGPNVARQEQLGHRHLHRPAKGRRPLHLPDRRRRPATAVPHRGTGPDGGVVRQERLARLHNRRAVPPRQAQGRGPLHLAERRRSPALTSLLRGPVPHDDPVLRDQDRDRHRTCCQLATWLFRSESRSCRPTTPSPHRHPRPLCPSCIGPARISPGLPSGRSTVGGC